MKTYLLNLLGLVLTLVAVLQTKGEPVAPTIVSRGPHHRVWQRTNETIRGNGRVIKEVTGYVELATGLHYQADPGDPNSPWLESQEIIELFGDGAIARQGQHLVIFSPSITDSPAIDLLSVDGKRFRSRILGLALYSAANGQSLLFAEPRDVVGQLVAPNQILWPDCFTDIQADVRAVYTKAGLEVDVVLRSQIDPSAWGFDPATCRIQVWTEFFDPPAGTKQTVLLRSEADPVRRAAMQSPDFADETLFFGQMLFPQGRAFAIETEAAQNAGLDVEDAAPVGKEFAVIDSRSFLVESVEYPSIKPLLDTLPVMAANNPPNSNARMAANKRKAFASPSKMIAASAKRVIEKRAGLRNEKMQVAQAISRPKPGVVLDYVQLNSDTNSYVFRNDTTYFISAPVILTGPTILEAAVIKSTNGTTSKRLSIQGPLDCRTSQYHPAIFTGKSDATVGEVISGSTDPTTNYFGIYLDLSGNTNVIDLHDVHLRHAYYGIQLNSASQLTLSHARITRNYAGLVTGGAFKARNVLIHDGTYVVGSLASGAYFEQTTFHRQTYLRSANYTTVLTNCLIISVTNNVFYSGANIVTNLDDTGIFQTVGAGARYLANNSPYRNTGTTNINSDLLAALKKRTTYPPIVLTNNITANTTLYPQAPRETALPSLGYCYDSLDFVLNKVALSNATLTITPGTAIGIFGDSYDHGLWLQDGGNLICEGTPENLCHIVRYNLVQEQANTNWSSAGVGYSIKTPDWEASPSATARFRFTDFATPAAGKEHYYAAFGTMPTTVFRDCQFLGGIIFSEYPPLAFTNCLFERVQALIYGTGGNFQNNLFVAGTLGVDGTYGPVNITDNLFDGTLTNQFFSYPVTNHHNGYLVNSNRFSPNSATDVILSNVVYETGPLGRYYLPTNSLLINTGSVSSAASVGLYHYTTTANPQAKETNSVLDIGLHWIAVTNGVPIDGDGDLLADGSEDQDGDGVFDSGTSETDWQSYTSPNGLGTGPGLQVFTPLK